MKIEYSSSKILNLLNDFSNCTNLVTSLQFDDIIIASNTDSSFSSEINSPNSFDSSIDHYCKLIQGRSTCVPCIESDKILIESAKKKKATVIHTCHAGLCETVTPIILDNIIVGYIMCGKFIDSERYYSSVEKIKSVAQKYNLNEQILLEQYSKLPVISKDALRSALNILNICIRHLLQEHFLEMRDNKISRQIQEYIADNISEPLTISHLCKVFFTNKQKLNSIFRESFNSSPRHFIITQRIEKAKTLLLSSNKSISEIAFETGFPNYTYFIKTFKKQTGISPLKFRKLNKENA